MKGQPEDAILQIQEWGTVNNWLKSILQTVQAGRYTNVVVLTHVLYDEEYSGTGINKTLIRTKIYPLMGTKTFSTQVGKYFGTIVHLEVKNKKHVGVLALCMHLIRRPNHDLELKWRMPMK